MIKLALFLALVTGFAPALGLAISDLQSDVQSDVQMEMTADQQQNVFSGLGIEDDFLAQQAFFEQMHSTKIHHGGCMTQKGRASWYGPGFAGHLTASGQVFRPDKDLSAASLTIPLGTRVKVTNISNRQSIMVVVNDRGPYVPGRIMDLSAKAAKRIGIVKAGTGTVRIDSCF
jgi:rare lipoprotein A (peptidoglycan hydrolase)